MIPAALLNKWRISAAALFLTVTAVGVAYAVLTAADFKADHSVFPPTKQPLSNDDLLVAQVGNQPIFLSEFTQRLENAQSNNSLIDSQATSDAETSDYSDLRRTRAADFAPADVTLGVLILESALFQRAVQDGFAATSKEVNDGIKGTKGAIENGVVSVAYLAYLNEVGEERFWADVYPFALYQTISIEKLRASLDDVSIDLEYELAQPAWLDLQEQVLDQTEVVLINSQGLLPATLEGAMEYLNAIRKLDREYVAQAQ